MSIQRHCCIWKCTSKLNLLTQYNNNNNITIQTAPHCVFGFFVFSGGPRPRISYLLAVSHCSPRWAPRIYIYTHTHINITFVLWERRVDPWKQNHYIRVGASRPFRRLLCYLLLLFLWLVWPFASADITRRLYRVIIRSWALRFVRNEI